MKIDIDPNFNESCFPPIQDLFLFKLISKIFPVSDFQHSIVTPTLLLMGQCLLQVIFFN